MGLSRREADEAIIKGLVTVDGEKAMLGDRVLMPENSTKNMSEKDNEWPKSINSIDKISEVCYNGKIVPFEANFTYLALNKPAGYVCSRRRQGETPTLYELLPKKYHELKTVGRLDKDSAGLIILTNDGDFGFQMTHPKFQKSKSYIVILDRGLEPLHQQMINENGLMLKDGISRMKLTRIEEREVTQAEILQAFHFAGEVKNDKDTERAKTMTKARRVWRVEIAEGRNRQIRRTFGALGYTVIDLMRTRFGAYQLSGLPLGEWTEISSVRV